VKLEELYESTWGANSSLVGEFGPQHPNLFEKVSAQVIPPVLNALTLVFYSVGILFSPTLFLPQH